MPRRRQSNSPTQPQMDDLPPPDLVDGVPVPVLEKRLAAIRQCKQVQGDSNTAHATAWKDLEESGVASNQGWKWGIKLERMEVNKRAAVLASFDAARAFLNLDAQLAMNFDEKEPEVEAASVQDVVGDLVDEVGAAEAPLSESEPPAADQNEDSNEWSPADTAPDDPALDQGGSFYDAGRNAGLDGAKAKDNPYPKGRADHGLWEAGRKDGQKLRAQQGGITITGQTDVTADELPPLGSERPAFPTAATTH